MKKILLLFLLAAGTISGQFRISGSMGINYFASSSMKDYLNMHFPSNSGMLPSFTASVGFYGEAGYRVSSNFEAGAEYVYQIYSYNAPSISGGQYNFALDIQKFSIIGYYVIPGEGYELKFGAGAGIRFASVDEEIYSKINYKSTGIGFFTRAAGLTPLGKNLFANMGVEAGYDVNGEPERNGIPITNATLKKNVNLNNFYLSLKLGVTYNF